MIPTTLKPVVLFFHKGLLINFVLLPNDSGRSVKKTCSMRYPSQDRFSPFCPLCSSAVSVKNTFKRLPAAVSLPAPVLSGAQRVLGTSLLQLD